MVPSYLKDKYVSATKTNSATPSFFLQLWHICHGNVKLHVWSNGYCVFAQIAGGYLPKKQKKQRLLVPLSRDVLNKIISPLKAQVRSEIPPSNGTTWHREM